MEHFFFLPDISSWTFTHSVFFFFWRVSLLCFRWLFSFFFFLRFYAKSCLCFFFFIVFITYFFFLIPVCLFCEKTGERWKRSYDVLTPLATLPTWLGNTISLTLYLDVELWLFFSIHAFPSRSEFLACFFFFSPFPLLLLSIYSKTVSSLCKASLRLSPLPPLNNHDVTFLCCKLST